MGKIKKFWNKLRYWQKGGIISFTLGFTLFAYLFILKIIDGIRIGDIGNRLKTMGGLVIPFLLLPLVYGILIGYIYSYLFKKEQKEIKNKLLKILVFIIIVGVSLFLLFLLILYIIARIAQPY